MYRVSIIGASSFAGGELIRLLLNHGGVTITHLTANTSAGEKIQRVFPHLYGFIDQTIETLDVDTIKADSDLAFIILPHGKCVTVAAELAAAGIKVIDIGADFRFRDGAVFEEWYHVSHANHPLTKAAVYGLPELYREKIKQAQIVGNPGCYTTASILAMYPLVKEGVIDRASIIIDAKSGVSGAGKTPSTTNLYGEANESVKAYNVGKHRHTPEIEQALTEAAGKPVMINFTPHLIPMTRGILATCYGNAVGIQSGEDLQAIYEKYYGNEPFIRIHQPDVYPQTKWTVGSNLCHIGYHYDERTGRIIVTSAIDNLGKGAAGQAVQNMNLLLGLPEAMGLGALPQCP